MFRLSGRTVQGHAMKTKQRLSKSRLRIVFPKRKEMEDELFMGWKALTILIIILSLVRHARFIKGDVKKNRFVVIYQLKILDQQKKHEKENTQLRIL